MEHRAIVDGTGQIGGKAAARGQREIEPENAPVVGALTDAIQQVTGREASLVASPGTYDHKHVARLAGVPQCVAYGPGQLDLAHQPDEYCSVEDIITATKVLALAVMKLAS